MNVFERAIAAVSPMTALKRQQARAGLQILNSGYGNHGANHNKKSLLGWTYGGGSHKEDIEDNLQTLRERSRDLYAGGGIATGAVKRMRTNVVGTGLRLKSTIDEEFLGITETEARQLESQIEREFSHWANSPNCDLERLDNFYELQQLVFLNILLSGDALALLPTTKRAGSIYDLRIQLVEADRLSTPDAKTYDPKILSGVEKNDAGEVVAYYISNHHPLSFSYDKPREWKRIEAYGKRTGRRNVIHMMNRERIGQLRGVPFLAPVIESLKQLERYTEAELVAAVVSGLFAVFIEKENASDELPIGESIPEDLQVDSDDENSIELAPGAVFDLGEGEKANAVTPGRPNANFEGFVTAVSKQIGAALEEPYEVIMLCFSNNYSASRGALLEFWKTIRMHRGWFGSDFCQPIFEEWMCEAVAKGRIVAPGFFGDPLVKEAYCSAEWNGPSQGQLDPKKEVEAAELRVQGGYSTRDKETTELTGTDFFKNIKQRKREEKLLKEVSDVGKPKQEPVQDATGKSESDDTDIDETNIDETNDSNNGTDEGDNGKTDKTKE